VKGEAEIIQSERGTVTLNLNQNSQKVNQNKSIFKFLQFSGPNDSYYPGFFYEIPRSNFDLLELSAESNNSIFKLNQQLEMSQRSLLITELFEKVKIIFIFSYIIR
jgi:hypothetical protein